MQHTRGAPYFGSNEAELRTCARAVDAGITRTDITLDGEPVPVREVESGLLHLDLPADNIFGAAAGDTGEGSRWRTVGSRTCIP